MKKLLFKVYNPIVLLKEAERKRRLDWIHKIQVGDIILEQGTNPRVVRSVSRHFKYGRWHTSIDVTIKRRSWTNRCYTVLNEQDLIQRNFLPSGLRKTHMELIDKRINWDVNNSHKPRLTAKDVEGII